MSGLFGCLFTLFFFFIFIAFGLFRMIGDLLFGSGRRSASPFREAPRPDDDRHTNARQRETQQAAGRKGEKIFEQHEGEYVDFEEIK